MNFHDNTVLVQFIKLNVIICKNVCELLNVFFITELKYTNEKKKLMTQHMEEL